jgi:hypothetical protein
VSDHRPEDGRAVLDETIGSDTLPESVTCPFCREDDTEVFSPFGGQVSTSQYYCRKCRTVFDYLRWR